MTPILDGLPIQEFIKHFLQEMVCADAQAQILQQTGWIEFRRSIDKLEGIDLTEGVGQLEYLSLREIKMTFYVEPIQPGFWNRMKKSFRFLLGKPETPAKLFCRLVPGVPGIKSAFAMTLTVSRTEDGSFSAKSEPEIEKLGGVYVADIFT